MCTDQHIDRLLVNGTFFVDGKWHPKATAAALAGDRIVALVDDPDDWSRPGVDIVDLQDAWVLPGLQDAHVHPAAGGLEMNRCNLAGRRTAAEYFTVIADYAAAHPDAMWILGGGWYLEAFDHGVPTASALDAVVADRPVFLPNRDHHSAWVNSAALRLAGIDERTPDPSDGRIERDATGAPSGALHEGAMDLVARLIPATTQADIEQALLTAQGYLHSLGITGWQDALVGQGLGMPDAFDAYLALTGSGRLTARVVGALWWDRMHGLDQLASLCERRARADAAGFTATTVKIMQDGVCENFTAALLSNYRDGQGRDTGRAGVSFVDPELLVTAITALDAAGFQVHVHAIGDRAVRESLDAIAAARTANGLRDNRHHLAHLELVHPDDVPRFAELGVTANMQALWACNEPQLTDLTLPFLAPDTHPHVFPFGALAATGTQLACGSDWPVSTPDPFQQMHVAVNRTEPPQADRDYMPPLLPEQRLTARQALDAFTRGSAYVNHLDQCGSLRPGNFADFTVIDGDLLDADTESIAERHAVMTIVGAEVVHTA